MVGWRCSYKCCRNVTRSSENIHFFRYPVNYPEYCRKWIENACKPDFFNLTIGQLANKVVCELHFEVRCFSNLEKKRLFLNAVPTLDSVCDKQDNSSPFQEQRQLKDLQILPTNGEGAIFPQDTNTLEQMLNSHKFQLYVCKNKRLVHVDKHVTEIRGDVVYGVTNVDLEGFVAVETHDNKLFFKKEDESDVEHKTAEFNTACNIINSQTELALMEEGRSNGSFKIPVQISSCEKMNITVADKKEKTKRILLEKVVQRIKKQSKDIAHIKKLIFLQKSTRYRQNGITAALDTLKACIPATLFTLVKLSVCEEVPVFTVEELNFFKDIYATSPLLYDNLKNKYEWPLPDLKYFEECEVSD